MEQGSTAKCKVVVAHSTEGIHLSQIAPRFRERKRARTIMLSYYPSIKTVQVGALNGRGMRPNARLSLSIQ